MKSILRCVIFTFISIRCAQSVVGALTFGGNYQTTFLLVLMAFSVLLFFVKPLLKIVSLSNQGIGFLFILTLLILITLHLLTLVIPDFYIQPTTLSGLILFGFVLPSKHLNALMAGVFSSLVISVVYVFFDWISTKK